MTRGQRDDFSIEPLPREPLIKKIQRYCLALVLAMVIAALLVVIASVIGVAVAPFFERDDSSLLGQSSQGGDNPELPAVVD